MKQHEGKEMPKKEQWAEFKRVLSLPYETQYIDADGELVAFEVAVFKQRLEIVVFVNGEIDWKHASKSLNEDVPEYIKKFWSTRKVRLPKQEKDFLLHGLRGKARDRKLAEVIARRTHYFPSWRSPRSLITALKNRCQTVELISRDEYDWRLAARSQQIIDNKPGERARV